MLAECDIDGCGVLAIGRCSTCNSAFCATHKAFTSGGRAGRVDRCCKCLDADRLEQAKQRRASELANEPALLIAVAAAMVEHHIGGLEDRVFAWDTVIRIDRGRWRPAIYQRGQHTFVGKAAWPVGALRFFVAGEWIRPVRGDDFRPTYVYQRRCGVTRQGALVFMPAGIKPSPDDFRPETSHVEPAGFTDLKNGVRPESDLDRGLLGWQSHPEVNAVARAIKALDEIAQRDGLELGMCLDWSDEVALAVRRAGEPDR